jgi:hypothetical protein
VKTGATDGSSWMGIVPEGCPVENVRNRRISGGFPARERVAR